MRDDPMHETVFGPDANHRLYRLSCFFSALLPQMGQAPLAAWEAGRLVGVLGFFSPGTCRPTMPSQLRIACRMLSPNLAELWRLCDAGIAVLAKQDGRNERLVGKTKSGKVFCIHLRPDNVARSESTVVSVEWGRDPDEQFWRTLTGLLASMQETAVSPSGYQNDTLDKKMRLPASTRNGV
jgi:hypothetical protein